MDQLNTVSIIEQKFRIPAQHIKICQRQSLLAQLEENASLALTTIVSPAGYGKTTLISQFFDSLSRSDSNNAVWISLDASDNEANQFFSLFCHALVYIDVADSSLVTRTNNKSAKEDVALFCREVLTVLNEYKEQIYVHLDDFHFISNTTILYFIDSLINYCPANFHLIISSRLEPALEQNAYYVKGMLFKLSADDLRFTMQETQDLLGALSDENDLTALYEQTEGWPVAIQLLYIQYLQNPPMVSSQGLSNNIDVLNAYLKEQIFNKFDAQVQHFLLHTSFLDRFDIELANFICEIDNSAEIIEIINQYQPLTISLGDKSSFRYHHLFSDFLQQAFIAKVGENACNQLRSQSAVWFARNNYLSEAISQCARAKNINLACQLIAQAGGWEIILTKGIGYVEALLSHFSEEEITLHPTLGLLRCYFYLKIGNVVAAEEQFNISNTTYHDKVNQVQPSYMTDRDFYIVDLLVKIYLDIIIENDVENILARCEHQLGAEDHLGKGVILALGTLLYNQRGDFRLAEKLAKDSAIEMRVANCWIGVNYVTLHHGQSLYYRGELHQALEQFHASIDLAQKHLGRDNGLQSMSKCLTAEVYYQLGKVQEAKILLQDSIEYLESRDCWSDIYTTAFKLGVNLSILEGNNKACEQYIERGKLIATSRKLWRFEKVLDVLNLKVACHFSNEKKYNQLNNLIMRENYWQKEFYLWKATEEYHATLAAHFLKKNTSVKAQHHIDKLLKIGQKYEQAIVIAKAKLLQALVFKLIGNDNKAIDVLVESLHLCKKHQLKQVFYEVGLGIESLLQKCKSQLDKYSLSDDTIKLINETLKGFKLFYTPNTPNLGLSHREAQIAPLLQQGLSNKEISSALGITENTVKFHLKNLFTKLNVKSRNEASVYFLTANLK